MEGKKTIETDRKLSGCLKTKSGDGGGRLQRYTKKLWDE